MADWRIEMTNRRTIIVHASGTTIAPQQQIADALRHELPLDGTTEIVIRREPPVDDEEDDRV